jgi:hypothetical protein
MPTLHPREQLGLSLPIEPNAIKCVGCGMVLITHIFWDGDRGRFACIHCARTLGRSDPERFLAVSIDARGKLPGVDFMPAGQAIATLIRFGATLA